ATVAPPARSTSAARRTAARRAKRAGRGTRGGGTWAAVCSGVACAAEPGEDLPADRIVPVAERDPHRGGIGGPRPTAQHLERGAEEPRGVLAVGEGPEARVPVEVGAGPLPHVTEQLLHTGGAGRLGPHARRLGPEPRAGPPDVPRARIG